MNKYTYCGLNCESCEYKEKCNCGCCKETCGKPFHGECRLAKCAIEHNVEYCSLCDNFPCSLLNEFSYDKEHGDNGERIEALKRIIEKKSV